MSPDLVLTVLLVLLLAQAAYVLTSNRLPYGYCLIAAIGGVLAGELLSVYARVPGPQLGSLHPLADVLLVGMLSTVFLLFVPTSAGVA